MNKKQLDKMTPEEKQIAIAEICGWKYMKRVGDTSIFLFPPNPKVWKNRACTWTEQVVGIFEECDKPQCKTITFAKTCPDYLNSADAAVQLCDFAASKGWTCELNQGLNTCWECFFKRRTTERTETTREEFDGSLWEEHYFPADTLSEAISGAFLLTFLP